MSGNEQTGKVCILGATFGTNNMGLSALTAGTIKSTLYHFPDAEIFLLDYGKEKTTYNFQLNDRNIPIQLLNMRFSKKVYLKNNIAMLILLSLILKLIPSQKIKKNIISNNLYLNHIYESDIIGSIAGGDSFSDIYGLGRFFYISLPQLLVLFMGKDLTLLPQTLGPFKGKIARFIARYILNHAKTVYSRDYTGLRENQKFMGDRNDYDKYKFCYDVGFVVDPVKPDKMELYDFFEKTRDDHIVVGLNVSGLLFMGGYTQNNMFGLKIDYREVIYELIDLLIQKRNVTVFLVPHVFAAAGEGDSVICEKIYNELKGKYKDKIFVVQGKYNQSEIKYIIGRCDFFIGSRMHACIAALSQNIPTVSIAYSKKFFGVMQTIGVESLVADPCKNDRKEIMDIINEAFNRRDMIRAQLEKKMPEVKSRVLNLFNDLNRSF